MGLDVYVGAKYGFPLKEEPTLEDADPALLLTMESDPLTVKAVNAYITDAAEGKQDGSALLEVLKGTTFGTCGLYESHYEDLFVFALEAGQEIDALEQSFESLDFPNAKTVLDAEASLKTFCRALGIPYQQPAWYLVAHASS